LIWWKSSQNRFWVLRSSVGSANFTFCVIFLPWVGRDSWQGMNGSMAGAITFRLARPRSVNLLYQQWCLAHPVI
jgi:hypothetical protein